MTTISQQTHKKGETVVEIKILRNLSEDELEKAAREIYAVSQKAFTAIMAKEDTIEYFKEEIENPQNINVVALNKDGVIYAHLLAIPHWVAYEELKEHDPEMEDDAEDKIFYIESIASVAHERVFMHLINAMLREAQAQGKEKITMHIRTVNHLSSIICDMYPVESLRRIENWYGFGEPFDYFEGKISEVKWLNK